MPLLEDEHIILRAIEPEDLELLYQWENDTQLWMAGNTRSPYSRFQLKQYIAQAKFDIFEDGYLRLMMVRKEDNRVLGTVDLFDFDVFHSRVAIGLMVATEFRGYGYVRKSLQLTEKYVFNFLKINQLYAFIAKSNLASRKLFQGDYLQNGTLSGWINTPDGFEDVLVYQKFR